MVARLNAADRAVLEHVVRYRLTTATILAALDEPNGSIDESRATLDRLTASGWLWRQSLVPYNKSIDSYQLSKTAANKLQCSPMLAEPMHRDARIECFAIAQFCCGGGAFRRLFTRDEFVRSFASLWYPGQPTRYYLDSTNSKSPKLAFLKVDHGGAGRWDRLIDSCQRFLRQRSDIRRVAPHHRPQTEAFASLVNKGRFQISVLTALPDKQRAIEIEVERRRARGEPVPPLKVSVVEGLLELIVAPPRAAVI